jgi:hypothetical protein
MTKPKVFVGSASEARGIVDALEAELRHIAIIERWDVDVFRPGHFTLEELTRVMKQVDFAIFVLGGDDVTESRGSVTPSPRDNVIFEAGLFTAVLGRERTFYVVDQAGTKIPSDWAGLGYTSFNNTEERLRDKVYDAVRVIGQQIQAWHPPKSLDPLDAIAGHWWQFVVNVGVSSVLSLMEITLTEAGTPMLRGTTWSIDGESVARYRSQSAHYEEGTHTLHYSWEGEHPREQNVPRYFGVGKITFHLETGNAASRGEGWYAASKWSDVRDTFIKSTMYTRGSAEEVAILQDKDRDKRVSVIHTKLRDRNQLDV